MAVPFLSLPGLPARLAAFYFFFFAYTAAYVAYFPLYLAWRGLDASQIALVLALPQLARIFAPAAWGWLADRMGARAPIVMLSCASMAICFASLPLVEARWIAPIIGITGVVSAGALPLVEATTLGMADGAARYGPIRLWGSVGFIAVVLGGGAWLDVFPVATLAAALVVFAVGSLLASMGLPRAPAALRAQAGKFRVSAAARAVLGSGFCMAAAHAALYAFLTLHLQRLGYSTSAIGALWTLGVVAEIAVFYYLPALLRRFALSAILVMSCLCALVRFLAIGWAAETLILLLAAQLLHAATFGSFHAGSIAAIHRVFAEAHQGRGQALFSSMSYGAGGAVGALLAGAAWEWGGAEAAFTAAGLFGLLGAYFARSLRRTGL
ncbi:MAG TPA: MFS transporter [Burkholderiales bacterium]|nr:MFS transporter [Burkholderiales bacterium]